ncbi:aminotransferase class I/II-fold pyridoxal phosphate-dependent enzyme [Candidatus Roizmanbacteria bacterium]|jgi:aspartate/methionine/tyrosine aminotransferase|nr:aminotransferase class I/II-fold pyridoxal phosphate-dependent enzyme [Candidatus Roizmanbacteria bacterium]
MKVSQRLNLFSEYAFARLAKQISLAEQKSGRKVLNLGVGSPDFPPSQRYIDKLKEYLIEPDAHMYGVYGTSLEFAEALQNWYKVRFGVAVESDELYPLLGSKDGIGHLPLALLDSGSEVLVPDPGYPAFSGPVAMLGAKLVYYNLTEKNGFEPDLNELKNKITADTRLVWVNFPSNPTGQITSLSKLESLVGLAKKHQFWIVYDNAYSEITFEGYKAPSILQINGAKEVAVETGSFSKTFSFAGYRMGWIVGNHQVIAAISKVKSQLDSGMSKPLLKLGAYALNNFDRSWHKRMIKSYYERRQILALSLKKIGLSFNLPKAGLYLWAKIPGRYKNSEQFSEELLKSKQVLLTPGTVFGKNGNRFIRASICANIDDISSYL